MKPAKNNVIKKSKFADDFEDDDVSDFNENAVMEDNYSDDFDSDDLD